MIIEELEVESLIEEIYNRYGYDFRSYSRASLIRRIKNFLAKNNIPTVELLKKQLWSSTRFIEHFAQELTVNVTEMFRDPSFFRALREKVVPILSTYPHIKIWDAGCSTGEELFSLAIMLHEENLLHKTRIFATDINQKVLTQAKEGIFDMGSMSKYSKNYQESGGKYSLSDYYVAKYDYVSFDKSLIERVVFYPHNLATDGVFNEFQLIMCRNVLIYFDKVLQQKVLKLFYESLPPLGYLSLGKKETITWDLNKKFEPVVREEKIFKKIDF